MVICSGVDVAEVPYSQYKNFALTWSFGGNSSLISFCGKASGVIWSEHWITDCSDTFSFCSDGKLSNIGFSIPNENHFINIRNSQAKYGKLMLSSNVLGVIEPMPMRMFDPIKRKLICFDGNAINDDEVSFFKLQDDLELIMSSGCYCGYVLNNPLSYFSTEVDGFVDYVNKPSDAEYILMASFFEIMSDNNLRKCNDDIGKVVVDLKDKIMPSIGLIKSNFRKKIIVSTIQELLDFYC